MLTDDDGRIVMFADTKLTISGDAGGEDTFAALAFVIPEVNTAWMWTHEQPWRSPVKLSGLRSMGELVSTAKQHHGQRLSPAWPDG